MPKGLISDPSVFHQPDLEVMDTGSSEAGTGTDQNLSNRLQLASPP